MYNVQTFEAENRYKMHAVLLLPLYYFL